MAILNTRPGSSTAKQHQVLVMVAMDKGFNLAETRRMVGGSIRRLSAQEASDWIRRFSGRELPNPPGQAPRPYRRKRSPGEPRACPAGVPAARAARDQATSVRMVAAEHVEQIERLGLQYFDGDAEQFRAWLRKYHKVNDPRELATAARATNVIRVLKDMLTRKEAQPCRRFNSN